MTNLRTTLLSFLTLALLGFVGAPAPAQAQQGDIPTVDYNVRTLSYPDLPDIEPPDARRVELDNGLVFFILEDPNLPLINMSARIGVGSAYDPAEMVGLGQMTGTVMRSGGTESMTPDSLNRTLDDLGAVIETGFGTTSGTVYASTLAENIDQVLPMFSEVIRAPRFDEEKMEQARQQVKTSISRRNENPQQIAVRVLEKKMYGEDSPYARTPEYYTVDRVTRDDMMAMHQAHMQPPNTIISVWGDFDGDEMEDMLRTQFSDWQAPDDYERPSPPPRTGEREASVHFVEKNDVNQSTVLMGHVGEMTRDDPDYPAVTIMNEVLSGLFVGRLFKQVRTEMGLAYSVFGNYSAGFEEPGRFFAGVFTKSGTTVEAGQAVANEVDGLRTNPPTEEEVRLAKDSYLNSFVFNFDTKQEVLGQQMTYEYYDYPSDFLQQVKAGVENVTADDVLRVSEAYLYPSEARTVVVGRSADFSESLTELSADGTVDTVDVSIPTSPPSDDEPMSAEDAAKGMDMLAMAKDALGGDAIDAMSSMRMESSQAISTPQGEQTIQTVSIVDVSNKFRVEQTLPNGMQITIADDGSKMMMKTPRGTQQAPSQMRTQIGGQVWRTLPYLMANLDHEDLSAQATGTTTVDGTTYQTVKVSPPAGQPYTLLLNSDTHRPMRMNYTAMTRQGPVESTDVYSDYQTKSGVAIPFTTVTYQNGEKRATTTVTAVTINPDGSVDYSLGS